jgi:4-hydroxybenzoate polyprenyltransferase
VSVVAPSLSWKARLDAYERLVRLDKPIGYLLLLWPTLSALWFATRGEPSGRLVLLFTLGTIVMRGAGCAFNDWADREFDAHVKRTAQRPLATGEIAPWEALVVGAAFALAAFVMTALATNTLTVMLSVVALGVAIAYPFFKRFFALPQAFLGVAFSFGIPMAFAGALELVPPFAWWMFAFNLSGMAWLGRWIPMGLIYYASLVVAAGFAIYHLNLIRTRDRMRCFHAFLNNHWLGFAIFAGVAADFAWRYNAWPRHM